MALQRRENWHLKKLRKEEVEKAKTLPKPEADEEDKKHKLPPMKKKPPIAKKSGTAPMGA